MEVEAGAKLFVCHNWIVEQPNEIIDSPFGEKLGSEYRVSGVRFSKSSYPVGDSFKR
jgi:hypothetical protein